MRFIMVALHEDLNGEEVGQTKKYVPKECGYG